MKNLFLLIASGVLLSGQTPDAQLKALIDAAQQAEQREDLSAAAAAYKKILELKPDWASAEFNLALVYHSERKYRDAIAMLERALSHNSALTDAHLFLGSSYFHTQQYDKAVAELTRFTALDPNNEEAAPLLADSYFRLGSFDKAATIYARLVKQDPAKPEPYYYLREALLSLAGECLRDLHTQPEPAYFRELFTAEELASKEAAEKGIRHLIKREPNRPEAYIALGELQRKQGNEPEAQAAFDEAVKRDAAGAGALIAARTGKPCPASSDLLTRTACLASEGNLDEAAQAVIGLRDRQPRNPRELYWAAHLFARVAERTIESLAAHAPQSSVLAIMRAKVFEQAGDTAHAEAEYGKALGLSPDAEFLIEYGKFKCRISEFNQAISLFEKALKSDIERADVHGLLAEVYMIQGDAAKALPHARTAVTANPASTQSRIYLAQALHKMNRIAEAIHVLEAAPADPDGRAHYLLGRYLTQQGRKEEANRALDVFKQRRQSGGSASGSLTGAAVPEP